MAPWQMLVLFFSVPSFAFFRRVARRKAGGPSRNVASSNSHYDTTFSSARYIEPGDNSVRPGIHVLLAESFRRLSSGKVGVVANATSIFPDMTHLVDALHAAPNVRLVAIFGPEHGFRGAAQAGHSEKGMKDKRTQVPIYDIYGKSGKSLAKVLEASGIDILLFDIQDVGVRFYTFIWTLYDCMVAAALASRPVRVIVADRPNPLGGLIVDGPTMQAPLASFVGRKAITLRHGMTVGELALLFNEEFVASDAEGKKVASLEVVKMTGWNPGVLFAQTGLQWVAPSPNMPTETTALVYCGTALLEGTNLSEGRGTTQPFELIGAPWMDFRWAAAAQASRCPGALFREAIFVPTFGKYSGEQVAGLQIHVTDPCLFNPLQVAVTLLSLARHIYGPSLVWRVQGGKHWIDMLTGGTAVREGIDAGDTYDEICASWQEELTWFTSLREHFLLYKRETVF
eukprot:TRINITY_DN12332_c0_g1_i2.p1 TRINITY_DN12332_c0_g1~~TRINITY_DN12332_c0_g1_i2.p1  ORF type:complete len:455 (+),score=63.63 TRINITY_DN12332_c0_g1_i2:1039-2403(+)